MAEQDNAHRWIRTATYGYAHFERCDVCQCSRCYSWSPGWPGSYEYYTPDGEGMKLGPYETPPCTTLPVGGLFDGVVTSHGQ